VPIDSQHDLGGDKNGLGAPGGGETGNLGGFFLSVCCCRGRQAGSRLGKEINGKLGDLYQWLDKRSARGTSLAKRNQGKKHLSRREGFVGQSLLGTQKLTTPKGAGIGSRSKPRGSRGENGALGENL